MGKLRTTETGRGQDRVSLQESAMPLKLCFSFQYVTSNKNFTFGCLDTRNRITAYEELLVRLKELSRINVMEAHQMGKETGMEKIPYSQLRENMQQVCNGTGIVSADSKMTVFRFCHQKYRLLCKDDNMHPNLMHIIAFDFDFSAYDHGK